MIEIEAPDGSIVEFPDGTPDAVMEKAMREAYGVGAQPHAAGGGSGGTLGALLAAPKSGFLLDWDDEIGAGMNAPFKAAVDWMQGRGFDVGRAYSETQQRLDEEKRLRRQEHPIASTVGEIAGGLGTGAQAGKMGLTLAGRTGGGFMARTGAGVLEGAAYGGLAGAGGADPGERLGGAGTGAALGAGIGGTVGLIGGALANRSARQAANAAAPTADDLAQSSRQLYRAAEQEGVRFREPTVNVLRQNLKLAAGRVNDRLRPKTAGFLDDIDDMLKGDVPLEVFDEFRKGLGAEIRKATPDDARTLTAMKRVADAWADKVSTNPGYYTGDAKKALPLLKEARQMWGQHKKAEVIERILDQADVDASGRYTQSGFANAIRREMNSLYKTIQKGKSQGWTKEEIELIRQMAKGGSNSAVVNLMAKFAPRGVMSILAGQAVGMVLPGVGNVLVPLAGHAAGQAADISALQAAQTLRSAAAAGVTPQMARPPMIPNRLTPLIPGGTVGALELQR